MALHFHVLEVHPDVEVKINSKVPGVTVDDVVDALESVINSEWDDDLERGRRLYVWGNAGRRVIFVCLRPLDEEAGEWVLVTAYPEAYT